MRKLALVALSLSMLAGCGAPAFMPALNGDAVDALAYKAIGGKAYANFQIAPTLPKARDSRAAVKLTYLMNDDTAHQSPWSLKMLNMMDDLPQRNVHNVVFRDGGELGDSRLYYMTGDKNPNAIGAPESLLAPGVKEVQSNNTKVFSQIVGWTFDNYPGRRKYLQWYTHGGGTFGIGTDTKQTDLAGNLLPKEEQIQVMSVPAVGEALRQALKGRQLDMIYFRACLMGNVEALYELRGTTRYAIASEEVSSSVDNTNLTMTKLFDDLASQDVEPAEVARRMSIAALAKHPQRGDTYMGYETMAAIDISRMDELKSAINTLSKTLIAAMPKQGAAISAAYDATPEWSENAMGMRDLWAFTAQLQQKVQDPAILTAVDQVRKCQRDAMLHEKDNFGSAANGLSILMPKRDGSGDYGIRFLTTGYQQTRFAKDSNWDDFLKLMLKSAS